MIPLIELWLPVLLAAVAVFIVSSIVHMCTPLHKTDHGALDGEEDILDAIRAKGIQPGSYRFPFVSCMKDMESESAQARYKRGPVGLLTVLPSGLPKMGKSLLHWFLFCILVSIFVAYLARLAMAPGASCSRIAQFTGTAAFLGYGVGAMMDSIWKGVSWGVTAKFLLDGLLYAAATAAVFCWLWPA